MKINFNSQPGKSEHNLPLFSSLVPLEIDIWEGDFDSITMALHLTFYGKQGQLKQVQLPVKLSKHPYQSGKANNYKLLSNYRINPKANSQVNEDDVMQKAVIQVTAKGTFKFDLSVDLF